MENLAGWLVLGAFVLLGFIVGRRSRAEFRGAVAYRAHLEARNTHLQNQLLAATASSNVSVAIGNVGVEQGSVGAGLHDVGAAPGVVRRGGVQRGVTGRAVPRSLDADAGFRPDSLAAGGVESPEALRRRASGPYVFDAGEVD